MEALLRALAERLAEAERRIEALEMRAVPDIQAAAAYTPTYIGGTTAGTTTYAANGQVGWYVRLGPLVVFTARVEWTAATGTGEARVSLPLAAANVANRAYAVSANPFNTTYSQDYLVGQLSPNTAYVAFRSPLSNAASTVVQVEAAGILVISGFYSTS